MKKVRYALGALGVAQALGLLAPAANAATAQAHAPKHPVKAVSLRKDTPLIVCGATTGKNASANHLHAHVTYQGHCVHFQSAYITHSQNSLTERVRFYNSVGTRIAQTRIGGHQGGGRTTFKSSPNVTDVYKICEALVFNGTSSVNYGPVCENI
jgi:hypothetical protein